MSETKIKICGLFRPEDAEAVNKAGPDFAGLVFYEKSRRYISPNRAEELRRLIDPAVATVGVFVEAGEMEIVRLYRRGVISIAQLHGGEDEDYIKRLRDLQPDLTIWQAYVVRSRQDIEQAAASPADVVLLDNGYGTGRCFDWTLIGDLPRPFILAGGITPENITEAITRFHPYALDISSGVESAGVKDGKKIAAAVAEVRRS